MTVSCLECKNDIDVSDKSDLAVGQIIECPTCGITLSVTAMMDGIATVDIEDEGK